MLTESVVDAHSPSHTLLTLDGREDLGRVLEGDRSLTEGVADSEQVDEPDMVSDIRRNSVTETYKTIGPSFSAGLPVVLRQERPAASRKMHMRGKVIRVNVLRPLVSMRNKVGIVKTTWIAPYPREAYRACVEL